MWALQFFTWGSWLSTDPFSPISQSYPLLLSVMSKSRACLGFFQMGSTLPCSRLWPPLLSLINQHSLTHFTEISWNLLSTNNSPHPISFIVLFLFSFFNIFFFLGMRFFSHLKPEFFGQFDVNFNLKLITQGTPWGCGMGRNIWRSPLGFPHLILL